MAHRKRDHGSEDWDDIITAHTDDTFARSWSMQNKKLGKFALSMASETKRGAETGTVKAVCVSACGNFGIGASSTGAIHMFNMQSGIRRKTFKLGFVPQKVVQQKDGGDTTTKSSRAVTGLGSDALNRVVIASTQDGTMNVSNIGHILTRDPLMILIVLQLSHR